MKTKSLLLFILSAAFFLTSCGAKKTAATLEVSTSALSVNNTTYTGGLVIMGSSKLGSFTIPIPANTGSGNKITLDLPRASWTFSAVGWEGPNQFEGNSKCGSQSVDLNSDEQTVNLNISYANCVSSTFGSAVYRNGNAFENLNISTCGWLYTDNVGTPVLTTTPLAFCDNSATFDAKYKKWAKSIKVEVERNINGVKSPGLSTCVTSGTDGAFSAPFGLPETGLPVKITLFSEVGCSSTPEFTISTFNFKEGLAATHTEHDAVFGKAGAQVKLFLPSFDTKRGFTSFLADRPALLCNSVPCLSIPTSIGGSEDRLISPGREFVLVPVPGVNQSCENISSVTSANITNMAVPPTTNDIKSNCGNRNGRIYTRIHYDSMSASASLTVNFSGGAPVTVTLKENAFSRAHEYAWDLIGYPLSVPLADPVKYSFPTFFHNHGEDSGLLTEAREMLGPEGAAGILGPNLNCATDTAVNYVTFFEEGFFKTYKVELQNVLPLAQPLVGDYLAESPLLLSTDSFQKKILVSRVSGSTNVGETMIHFNCGANVGRLETIHQEDDRVEKRLVEWNTGVATKERVREIKYEEETVSGMTTRLNASYRFAEAPTDPTKVYARGWDLYIHWNGTDYDFHASSSQVNVKDGENGFRFIDAPTSNSNASISDTTYISGLATAVGTPSAVCVAKGVFGAGTCTTPITFSGEYFGGTVFDETNLTPTNIQSYFTAF